MGEDWSRRQGSALCGRRRAKVGGPGEGAKGAGLNVDNVRTTT